MNQEMIVRKGRLATPTDFGTMFGREAPLALEVGFGDGRYLAHLARAHSDWNLMGAEVSLGSLWRAWRRMKRVRAEHVRLYKGHARFLVRDVIPDASLECVYVNFPDPWPRKRHWKNRLLQESFYRILSGRLVDGGSLFLTTDHPEYFAFAIEQARLSECFEVLEGPAPPATLETKYARKWRDQDKPIHHARFRLRRRDPAPSRIIQTEPMQHAFLRGRLSDLGPFTKQVRSFDGGAAIVLDAWRRLDGDGILFRCIIEEPDLHQEVMVLAGEKEGGVYVALQPFGDPMSTNGVREAVRAVADWLGSQGLEMEKSWI